MSVVDANGFTWDYPYENEDDPRDKGVLLARLLHIPWCIAFEDIPQPIVDFLLKNPPLPKPAAPRESSPVSDDETTTPTSSTAPSTTRGSALSDPPSATFGSQIITNNREVASRKRTHASTMNALTNNKYRKGITDRAMLSYYIPPNVKAADGTYPSCYHWYLFGDLGFDVWVGIDGTLSRDPPDWYVAEQEEKEKAEAEAEVEEQDEAEERSAKRLKTSHDA